MIINIQDDILKLHAMGLLDRLLQDKTTGGNILWATDAYSLYGEFYSPGNEIRSNRITGECSDLIKTRARRAMEQRTERTRQHAEVVTPLWIIKKMNDFADEQWFERKTGVYKLTEDGKIFFNTKKHWKLYVDARRMEITCGEAPFLATRYDVETGEAIPIEDRIGLLDRKLRAVTENTQDIEEWKTWALRAVQAIYGYELQGDNLLIARVNLLCAVEEHMFHRWRQRADKEYLGKLCNVIAWNLWQMDGIMDCVPVPPKPTEEQLSFFEPIQRHTETDLFGDATEIDIPCRLFDWRRDRSISYTALREKGSEIMKLDFIIGNPPYQENQETNNKAEAIYHFFYDGCESIANKYMLISPARFLFNAGLTPKAWNKKMLSDRHIKVVYYFANSSEVFANTNINGGVAVIYRDASTDFGAIGHFVPNDILRKLSQQFPKDEEHNLSSVVFGGRSDLKFNDTFFEDYPNAKEYILKTIQAKHPTITSLGPNEESEIKSSSFERTPFVFYDTEPDDTENYYKILGIENGKRVFKWVKKIYLSPRFPYNNNIDKYKVFVSNADGAAGQIGKPIPARIIGRPIVAHPSTTSIPTFMSIGCFDTEDEALNLEKYVQTRFVRTLVGIVKITQHITPSTWAHVPIQDFTSASDIDWSRSISEIDQQLYKKYGLKEDEIAFIESHVKEMS